MSHELRAPLHAMLGILEQVQKTSLSSEVHKQLDIVETSGQHLLNLVNNLLDASKLKNSSLTLQTSVFDLLELVRNGYNLFASRIQDKGLTFDIVNNLKADQCLIETDKSRLYQVIINLLSNAMKFTTSGKVSLLISNGDEGGISLEVVDTGEGIENMSAIFQPFFSKDVSEKYDELSSTGLGLSVAKEIIHALGFDLSVQSTVCKGSTFSINIPHTAVRTQTALNLSESKLLSDNAKPLTMKSWSGKSVLEIDDSQINLIVIQAMLSSSPLDMIVANSVDEALVILEEQPVDIVISDLHMPHKGGLELSKQMRLNKKTRSRPLIIASADIRQEAWPKCEDAGVTDYLEKPFNENKLLNLIEVYLTP